MTAVSDPAPPSRVKPIGVWVLRVLLAAVFGSAGVAKLIGVAMLVAEFEQIGLGQWFRYVTGLIEVVAAILLLVPSTGFFGAVLALCVCIGAFAAQIGPLHGDVVHVIVLAGLVALAAWLLRPVTR